MRNSIWILPLVGMLAAVVVIRPLHWIERSMGWESKLDVDTARGLLGTMAASMFTFIVYVSSALLLAVQLASAQLSPRIIGFMFSDRFLKIALTVFVFTFAFTVLVFVRITTSVPLLTMRLAAASWMVSIGLFLYMIDHVGRSLRANGALRDIGSTGRRIIENVYPRPIEPGATSPDPDGVLTAAPTQTISSKREGTVLAFDAEGLGGLAHRHDCLIEIVPRVGDFVATGDPLFQIFGGGVGLRDELLRQSIAIGRERTFEQDPAFAFRIIVDIASKALSRAINDPTTAVLAVDELHHLLRTVGKRHLDDRVVADATGKYRLAYHTPNWDDFVSLAVTEIRQYGGESIQVVRRLRAMLESLLQSLPESRHAPLLQELALLRRAAERFFAEPEDRALAEVCDPQGVGGRHAPQNHHVQNATSNSERGLHER